MKVIWKACDIFNRVYDQGNIRNEPRPKRGRKSVYKINELFKKINRTKALISKGYMAYDCSG